MDIVQNVWSLAIVCFTMMLMKITKYINMRQKNGAVSTVRAEFRENMCILLSKINSLLSGRHRDEIQKARYYLKEELCKSYR
jgi:hypothetical protein